MICAYPPGLSLKSGLNCRARRLGSAVLNTSEPSIQRYIKTFAILRVIRVVRCSRDAPRWYRFFGKRVYDFFLQRVLLHGCARALLIPCICCCASHSGFRFVCFDCGLQVRNLRVRFMLSLRVSISFRAISRHIQRPAASVLCTQLARVLPAFACLLQFPEACVAHYADMRFLFDA